MVAANRIANLRSSMTGRILSSSLLFRQPESSVKVSGPIPNRPYGVPARTHYDCSNFGGPYVDSYFLSPFRHGWSWGLSSYLLLILFDSWLARPLGVVC